MFRIAMLASIATLALGVMCLFGGEVVPTHVEPPSFFGAFTFLFIASLILLGMSAPPGPRT